MLKMVCTAWWTVLLGQISLTSSVIWKVMVPHLKLCCLCRNLNWKQRWNLFLLCKRYKIFNTTKASFFKIHTKVSHIIYMITFFLSVSIKVTWNFKFVCVSLISADYDTPCEWVIKFYCGVAVWNSVFDMNKL